MFEAFKEIADTVREASFDLAARAMTGFMGLYREIAMHVEEQTGFNLPLSGYLGGQDEGGYSSGSYLSQGSQVAQVVPTTPTPEKEVSTPEKGAPKPAAGEKEKEAPQKDASKKELAGESAQAAEGGEGKGESKGEGEKAEKKSSAKKTKKRATKKRPTKKRATNKSGAKKKTQKKKKGRKNQLIRVLKMLHEDTDTWMSASELSNASEEQGSKILPGNVRKVIRQRGEPYIETRPRAGSRRGSLEFNITDEGVAHLEEFETK